MSTICTLYTISVDTVLVYTNLTGVTACMTANSWWLVNVVMINVHCTDAMFDDRVFAFGYKGRVSSQLIFAPSLNRSQCSDRYITITTKLLFLLLN